MSDVEVSLVSGGLSVRDARGSDAGVIAGFNAALAWETESKRLDAAILARGVAAALAEPDRLRYWVAELGGEVVGMAAVTREWSDWRCGWLWWLQSVYVAPEARRSGVFRALHEHIRGLARAGEEVIGLRLYVEVENARARATYAKLGLKDAGYSVYEEIWGIPGCGG